MNRLILLLLLLSACRASDSPGTHPSRGTLQPAGPSIIERYLDAPYPPADGFDFPFGDGDGGGGYTDRATGKKYTGWHIATRFTESYTMGLHTGEDWNGDGGGSTDHSLLSSRSTSPDLPLHPVVVEHPGLSVSLILLPHRTSFQ